MKKLVLILLLFFCAPEKVLSQVLIKSATLIISPNGSETKNTGTIFSVKVKKEEATLIFTEIGENIAAGNAIDFTTSTNVPLKLKKDDFIKDDLAGLFIEFHFTTIPDSPEEWNFDYYLQFDLKDGTTVKTKTNTLKVNTGIKTKYKEQIKPVIEIEDETDKNHKFMYLNAFNFDFTTSKTGYVGQLNMYSKPNSNQHWGFNAGLTKINYSNQDSTSFHRTDKVKINPLDEIQTGSRYIRQYNQYKYKTENRSFSIYFQPLLDTRLFKEKSKFYIHGHTELLISRFETTTSIITIQQDTITATDEIDSMVRPLLNRKVVKSQNILNGYFGLGFTFDLYLNKASTLFVQPTVGKTTNYPQPASVNESTYYRVNPDTAWHNFYLIRAYYRNKLASGSELIIGSDIRGLFPMYEPFYAVYLGANIPVDKILDLIK